MQSLFNILNNLQSPFFLNTALMIASGHLSTHTMQPPSGSTPVTINIVYNTASTNNATNSNESAQSVKTNQDASFMSYIHFLQEKTKQHYNSLIDFVYRHPLASLGCLALISYSILLKRIIGDHNYFKNPLLWSHWHSELSLEQLQKKLPAPLTQELLETIYYRYINPANPRDKVTPLTIFMQDINQEIERLEQYLSRAQIINRFYLIRIFPLIKNQIDRLKTQLSRAYYVKQLFVDWAVNNNLQNDKT